MKSERTWKEDEGSRRRASAKRFPKEEARRGTAPLPLRSRRRSASSQCACLDNGRSCGAGAMLLAPTAPPVPSCTFRHAPDTAVLPLPHESVHHVHHSSVEACEAACCSWAWCAGFDYHRASSSCSLVARDAAESLLSTYPISGYDHYSMQARSTGQRATVLGPQAPSFFFASAVLFARVVRFR